MTWRSFLARFDGIAAPDWKTPGDLSAMGVAAMARQQDLDEVMCMIGTCTFRTPVRDWEEAQTMIDLHGNAEHGPRRLRIYRDIVGRWVWRVGRRGDRANYSIGYARSHGEALAVGLAALESASVGRG